MSGASGIDAAKVRRVVSSNQTCCTGPTLDHKKQREESPANRCYRWEEAAGAGWRERRQQAKSKIAFYEAIIEQASFATQSS